MYAFQFFSTVNENKLWNVKNQIVHGCKYFKVLANKNWPFKKITKISNMYWRLIMEVRRGLQRNLIKKSAFWPFNRIIAMFTHILSTIFVLESRVDNFPVNDQNIEEIGQHEAKIWSF